MKRIAYGESYFPGLIRDNSFYVDKTSFLAQLERQAKYVIFLRPRRFGKSLWMSLLKHYYGLQYADRFETIFGQLHVGQHPTPLANGFCILDFEFSRIDTTTPELTYQGFLTNVREGVNVFLADYRQFFSEEQRQTITKQPSPNGVMVALFEAIRMNPLPHPIYLLIDEYDHFTNELIALRLDEFREIVGKNGYVRKFYETLKTATREGIVERMFVTGVSPITMDSMTSGFNIGTHCTTNEALHNMIGFTEAECMTLLHNMEVPEAELDSVMADLRHWYDGYKFNLDVTDRLYNSDMVLYFAQEYQQTRRYPREMLDPNIAPDYGKVRSVFRLGDGEQVNRTILEELIKTGHTETNLTVQFSFEKGFTVDDFKSLLFYMGYLTIRQSETQELRMCIPNQVIRNLYWDYFASLIGEDTGMVVNINRMRDAVRAFIHNDPTLLIEQVERTLEALSNRDDIQLDEKHIKAIFVSFMGLSQSWMLKSEFETGRNYIDLLLLRRKPFNIPYQFVIEFKYLHKKQAKDFPKVYEGAKAQLQTYLQLPDIAALDSRKAWLFIFVGTKKRVAEEFE